MLQRIRNKKQGQKGFTLIELMIVIAIIGILAAIAIPNFISYRKRSYDSAAQSDLKNFMTAQEAYFVDYEKYADFESTTGNATTKSVSLGSTDAYISKGVTIDCSAAAEDSYTMTAYHSSGSVTWTVHGPGGRIEKVPS